MAESKDIATRLHEEAREMRTRLAEDVVAMRKQRESVGPRRRNKVRQWLLNTDIEQAMPHVERLQAVAKHQEGERTPCAACRFLGGE